MITIQTLQPVCRQDVEHSIKISLRGALAEEYYKFKQQSGQKADQFLNRVLEDYFPGVIREAQGDLLVVGYIKDKFNHPSTWQEY